MKLRQGTFSFLPDLTDAEIHTQVQYCIDNGWAVSVEYTDDPHQEIPIGKCGGIQCLIILMPLLLF